MRWARGISTVLFNAFFLLCSLTLIVALAFTGAGLPAIVSVFAAALAFLFLPFLPALHRPVSLRVFSRRAFPRAPSRS
jgi:hypothetical protein